MIIIISGTSSSGKSTLCHELQNMLGNGWLNFSTDGYLSMLGNKFLGLHPDNPEVCTPNEICYAKQHQDGTHEIIPGKLCSKLYLTIPSVLALIASQGFNIIVDSFITNRDEFTSYQEALASYNPAFIYLHASESIINQREEARGDRLKGSAVNWLKKIDHNNHDLAINTGKINTKEACKLILNKIKIDLGYE